MGIQYISVPLDGARAPLTLSLALISRCRAHPTHAPDGASARRPPGTATWSCARGLQTSPFQVSFEGVKTVGAPAGRLCSVCASTVGRCPSDDWSSDGYPVLLIDREVFSSDREVLTSRRTG